MKIEKIEGKVEDLSENSRKLLVNEILKNDVQENFDVGSSVQRSLKNIKDSIKSQKEKYYAS